MTIEAKNATVIFGAQLGASHITHAHQIAVCSCLQDDVFEFRRFDEAAYRADADLITLVRPRRRLANLAGSYLDVLLGKSTQNVGGSESARGHTERVEPQAHGVFSLAKILYVSDAGNTLQRVAHVEVNVVAEKKAAVLTMLGIDTRAEHEIARRLCDADAGSFHLVGKPAKRLVHAVLNVYGGEIDVARDVKSDVDVARAVISTRGGHVLHAFDAVDLLLERRCDRRFYGLRVGAVVEGAYVDLRRREIRKLGDWKSGNRHRARQNNQERADSGEDGPPDKEIDKHFLREPFCRTNTKRTERNQDEDFPAGAGACSVTGAPSTRFWAPSITTRSPDFRPSSTA